MDEESADDAVDDIRGVVGQALPGWSPGWIGDLALELLRLTAQHPLDMGQVELVERPQELADVLSDQCLGRDPKPTLVSAVGELAVERGVPVGEHGGDAVDDPSQQRLRGIHSMKGALGHGRTVHFAGRLCLRCASERAPEAPLSSDP